MARDAQQGAFERTVGGLNWPFADVLSVFSLGTGEKKRHSVSVRFHRRQRQRRAHQSTAAPLARGPSVRAAQHLSPVLACSAASRSTSHARCFRACLFVCLKKKQKKNIFFILTWGKRIYFKNNNFSLDYVHNPYNCQTKAVLEKQRDCLVFTKLRLQNFSMTSTVGRLCQLATRGL